MFQTVSAIIDPSGKVTLLEPVHFSANKRAVVMILSDDETEQVSETARLSEAALSDWNRPEEDAAWGAPTVGEVVLVPFPFSDLTQTKLRPAIRLAQAGRGDWILCQVTSNPFGDRGAVSIQNGDFARGSLRIDSFARPGKLFTAHDSLITASIGNLKSEVIERLLQAVVALFEASK